MAVCPPAEVLDAVETSLAVARRALVGPRWSPRAQWHLTLLFLGAVDALPPVVSALSSVGSLPPFRFRLGGGGAFPSERRGRVVWIGATEGGDDLAGLAGAVGDALAPLGYQADHARFRSHLTVARLKLPGDVRAAVEALGPESVGPAWTVDEVVLYESRLGREGASYRVLERVRLGGGGG